MKTCSVDGCDGAVRTRGMCTKHYFRWYRTGSTKRKKYPEVCTIDGCEKPFFAKDMCQMHYTRVLRTGSTGEEGDGSGDGALLADPSFWERADQYLRQRF